MSQDFKQASSLDINEFEKPRLPSGLNVLTILTIIWSIIGIIGGIWNYMNARKSYEDTKKMVDSGKLDEMPSFMRGMMDMEIMTKMFENRLPIFILTLVANGLCLWGAIEMRKLKKQGYTFWLIGELLPILTSLLFIGTSVFAGFGLIMWLFPIAFIILYTVNRKHLVY